ncbi:hypothetical protein ACFW04_013966 [Cataglyphis niger]
MDLTDQRLIELVKKCFYLYNKSNPDYKDKIKSQNSWCSITEALNATERFTREKQFLKVGLQFGSGFLRQSTPSELYKALQFLEPHYQSRSINECDFIQRSKF